MIDRLSQSFGRTVSVVFLIGVFVTAYEVVMRYVFNAPTIWAHELTILLCAIGYMLAGSTTLRERRHIAITLIYDRAGARVRRALDVVGAAVMVVYFAGLIWAAHRRAWTAATTLEGTGSVWNPPIPAIVLPVLIVAAVLMIWQAIANLRRDLRR